MAGLAGLIGVFGGTFDPIHYGHINPVQHLADTTGFARVLFVLSARPPHRDPPEISIEHRFRMLSLALAEYPAFHADDCEIKRPGPSYTVWTLRDLREEYENHSLCLILGMDAFEKRTEWYRCEEILALSNIIVMKRPGWKLSLDQTLFTPDALREHKAGIITAADTPKFPISATSIRERLAMGADVSDAMPDVVGNYIRKHELYREISNQKVKHI